MKPTITAFADSPDKGQGHARDMRVRWALEEVGQGYNVRLRSMEELKTPEHLALNPFGSIPTYEEGDLALFESGSIILHIAQRHFGLLPVDSNARARAITWMFAALNTVEPPIVEREAFMLLENDTSWFRERTPILEDNVRKRLTELSKRLGRSDWLEDYFTAGDLLMITVLRRLEASNIQEGKNILEEYPNLSAFVARGTARPAYQRAFADQLAVSLTNVADMS